MPNTNDTFSPNPHGAVSPAIDYTAVGAPVTKTYHGLSIVSPNADLIIGRIISWQPTAYTRTGTYIRELNNRTFGSIIDYVPGIHNDTTIALTRNEIWGGELEKAFGFGAMFESLMDQNRPFIVKEYLFKGNDVYSIWQYSGCWFTEKGEPAMTSDGDGRYEITATLAYVRRQRLT